MTSLSPIQRKVFSGCFIVYAGAYIARLNIAAALPSLIDAFSLTEAQAGLIQTLFAIVYAAGQLINGALVDRISAKRYIVAGLLLSALCNVLMGMAGAYWQLLLFWALNGVAQSMLWTPVVKLLAGWFTPEQRGRASMWISFSVIGGHFAAWAIAGYMAQIFVWRLSFWVPAAVLLCFIGLALWLLHDPDAPLVTAAQGDRAAAPMPLRTMLWKTGFWLVLLCSAANGFARDGVMSWGPAIVNSLRPASMTLSATTVSLIIPCVNLLGVLLGQVLLRRSAGRTRRIIAILMGAGTGVTLLLALFSGGSPILYALLLGACCALMYGSNPLITIVLPMDYARFGRVGLAAGMIDSFVYLGSAMVGISVGFLRDTLGLQSVFLSWTAAALMGTLAIVLSIRRANQTVDAPVPK